MDKVFKSGLSKFCERQPLRNLKGYGLLQALTNRERAYVTYLKPKILQIAVLDYFLTSRLTKHTFSVF